MLVKAQNNDFLPQTPPTPFAAFIFRRDLCFAWFIVQYLCKWYVCAVLCVRNYSYQEYYENKTLVNKRWFTAINITEIFYTFIEIIHTSLLSCHARIPVVPPAIPVHVRPVSVGRRSRFAARAADGRKTPPVGRRRRARSKWSVTMCVLRNRTGRKRSVKQIFMFP